MARLFQTPEDAHNYINYLINNNYSVLFCKTQCAESAMLRQIMNAKNIPVYECVVDLMQIQDGVYLLFALMLITQQLTMPTLFVRGQNVGGLEVINRLEEQGKFDDILKPAGH